MSASVSYWTGVWEPEREAISKEVATLRAALASDALVVSMSAGQRSSWNAQDRVVRLSGQRWMLLRAVAAAHERRAQITHVFGEMHAWHLLRALGRRPIIFTVAIPGEPLESSLYDKVAAFAAESEGLAEQLRGAGIAPARIRVIYPGIDLQRFRPTPSPSGRFNVLFASSPSSVAEFDARGIPLLIEAARQCPDIDVTLLWRQWGDQHALDRALAALNPPANVINLKRDVRDMSALFQSVHATAFLTAQGCGKSCPNSVIEGLATARPAIVSESCGIAGLLERSGAGIAVPRDGAAVAGALRTLQREVDQRSVAARSLAETHFGVDAFLGAYQQLYEEFGCLVSRAA